jgi:chemotaxis-related protein WspB
LTGANKPDAIMKVLVFHIGRERYALPLARVDKVLPVARLTALPGAPHYVPGLLDLHGEPVPVIDLSRLAGTPPAAVRYDTRILLVDVPAAGRMRRLGLKAERVAGVASIGDTPLESGVVAAPWLGQVAPGGAGAHGTAGMLHLLVPERLLAPEVARTLFGASDGTLEVA